MTSLFPDLNALTTKAAPKGMSTKSPLRYPGGKTRAVKILSALMPEDVLADTDKHVIAPFVGGGSFELWLTSQGKTVKAFDIFAQLAVFWSQCDTDPGSLTAELRTTKATGVDSDLFKQLQGELRAFEAAPDSSQLTKLEIATKFFAVNRCSFSGSTLSGGFSKQAAAGRFTESSILKVEQWNNPLFSVEHADAFTVLEDPELIEGADFMFLDPPYMLGKTKDKLYGDKGSTHDGFDHERLKSTLDTLSSKGIRFILTYNDSEEIRELYRDYHAVGTEWAYGMNQSKKSSEIILTNYDVASPASRP